MAANQWKFDAKIEIQMPKVEGKANTPKMRAAVNKALSKGVQKGATYVSKDLRAALDKSMSSAWAWRFGTRDIIDTGRLMRSLSLETTFDQPRGGFKIIGRYETPYAAFVHYGGVIQHPYGNRRAASVTIAGRPWVQAVFEGTYGQPRLDIRTPLNRAVSEAWTARFGT